MFFKYIASIIILIEITQCLKEDITKIQILDEQKILSRKLQSIQDVEDETKPLTWNEMFADVLVNKIKIFSFEKVIDYNTIEDHEPSKPKKLLMKCFSQIMLLYKTCIYDKWLRKYDEPEFADSENTSEQETTEVSIDRRDVSGPKDEIEIIEPKYHGRLQEADSDEAREVKDCPDGSIKDAKGKCVIEVSRLLISVPSQCPVGYRADRLGNCRMIFF